jgi:hypothetical protein
MLWVLLDRLLTKAEQLREICPTSAPLLGPYYYIDAARFGLEDCESTSKMLSMCGVARLIILGLAIIRLPSDAAAAPLERRPSLTVSVNSITSIGPQGGPFSPASFQFQISASGGTVRYSVTAPAWLTATPITGAADAGGVIINLTISSTAFRLPPGTYGPAVSFTNVSNGQGSTTRTARLIVTPSSKSSVPAQRPSASQSGGYLLDEKSGRLLDHRGEPLRGR